MANRRISELQELAGINLADVDLLTVVDVGEVDPALKNKKLTISGTKAYLNIYYVPRTGGTVSGSLVVQDDLTVQNQVTASGLNVTYTLNAGSLYVSGGTEISGVLSGTTITGTNVNATNINSVSFATTTFTSTIISGTSGVFTESISGKTITGITGSFTQLFAVSGDISDRLKAGTVTGDYGAFGTVTGTTGIYTLLSGTTVTGTTANFTTGNFQVLNAGSHTITGDLTVTGDLIVRGSGYFSSGIQVTGTLSGTTITGTTARFANITGFTVVGNTLVSGATVTGDIGRFSTITGNTAGFTTVTGQTVTGTSGVFTTLNAVTAVFTTGIVRENITVTGDATVNSDLFVLGSGYFSSGISVTGRVSGVQITGTAGAFTSVTGTTFTGTFVNAVSGVFSTQVSGLNVTGEYARFLSTESTVITGVNIVATTNISGAAGTFGTLTGNTAGFTSVTGETITGTTANFVSGLFSAQVSGQTVTGTTAQFTTGVFETIVSSSHTTSGDLIVLGSGYFSSGVSVTGTVSGITVTGTTIESTTGTFNTLSGTQFIAGGATFVTSSGDVKPYGLFSFPTTVGISGYVLQTQADGTTSWVPAGGGYNGGDFTIFSGNLIVSGSGYFSSGIQVTGDVNASTFTGALVQVASGIFASGTVSNPSVTFVDDLDTGAYSSASNELSVSIGGSSGITISSGAYGMVLTIWAT